jgi:hypothetical protein
MPPNSFALRRHKQYANGGRVEGAALSTEPGPVTQPNLPAFCLSMRNSLLVVILVLTAACGAYHFPGLAEGSGTVSGRVIGTPCVPVQPAAQDQACPPGPVADCVSGPNGPGCSSRPMPSMQLVFTNGNTSLTAQTDSTGDYSIELPAGTWVVNTNNNLRIISGPRTLVVNPGDSIIANYVADSGIRASTQSG